MAWESAEWTGYNNRLAVGKTWWAGRQPTAEDGSYPVTVELWARTNYGTYNFDVGGNWWGNWGDGSAVKRMAGSNPMLFASGTAYFQASWDGEQGFGIGFNASGPSAPPWFSVAAESGSSVRVTWGNSTYWPGPDGGRMYVGHVSRNAAFTDLLINAVWTNGGVLGGLTPGQTYWLRVIALGRWWDGDRYSAWSQVIQVTMPVPPTLASTPVATQVSRNSFVIPTATISNNGGSAPSNYRGQVNTVASETGATPFEQGAWAPMTVYNRAASTKYFYRVAAGNIAGWGAWTPWREVTTLSDAPSNPAAPVVSAVTETTATVTWVAPAANGATITGYTVEVAEAANPTVAVKTYQVGLVLSQAVTGLVKAKDYVARVRAEGTPASSGYSPDVAFRTTGTNATLFPMINDAGTWRPFEVWERRSGTWVRETVHLNVGGTWKVSE